MEARRANSAAVKAHEPEPARIPPPVEDGIQYLESLGPLVDRLMGDKRARDHADREVAKLVGETPPPEEPEPIEPPPPVEDNDTITRGADT